MMQSEWLPVVMEASFNEIYVIDCETLHILHINEAARLNLLYTAAELSAKSFPDILDVGSVQPLQQAVRSIHTTPPPLLTVRVNLVRRNGSRYPLELRLCPSRLGSANVCIAIGREAATRHEGMNADSVNPSLFSAIVSNTPGLVYQFQLTPDDKTSFTYLSEGCQALLGLSVEQLRAKSELFMDLVLPGDRPSYLGSMTASANELKSWNWEGRIWIDAWKDIKWINLRATPHLLPNKGVLWSGIMTNITQSKLEEFEIKRSRARLAELSAHIEHLKELERTQIAREVHDDLGGNLTAIKMALALLANRLPGQ